MLCEAKYDAGGPNQLADHHWKSWTLDRTWHPDKGHPLKNAPFGAFQYIFNDHSVNVFQLNLSSCYFDVNSIPKS